MKSQKCTLMLLSFAFDVKSEQNYGNLVINRKQVRIGVRKGDVKGDTGNGEVKVEIGKVDVKICLGHVIWPKEAGGSKLETLLWAQGSWLCVSVSALRVNSVKC